MPMQWATRWHGAQGKVHADKRTVEYCGRGNHSADAACFVGAQSVGHAAEERLHTRKREYEGRSVCLESPFDSQDGAEVKPEGAARVGGKSGAKPRNGETKKPKKKRRAKKKRRVEDESDEEDDATRRLPVYYFEVEVLATRHFQGTAEEQEIVGRWSRVRARSGEGNNGNAETSENGQRGVQGESGGEEEEEDEDDDMSSEDDAVQRPLLQEDGQPTWRGRARRLIREHMRAAESSVAIQSVPTRGTEENMDVDGEGSENQDAVTSLTNDASSMLQSTATLSPSPPSLAQQQLFLSFPLSSSTIQQIRLRLERQHQQAQTLHRRFSSTGPGSQSLSSAISSLHARHQRRESTMRQKRSNHRIAVGFLMSKSSSYPRDVCQEELGRQVFSIAFTGRNGSIMSNGQTYLQTDVRFRYGDTIGCGVILDARVFFWTLNGQLVAMLPVTDVHHFDDFEAYKEGSDVKSESEWYTSWTEQLRPAISLHEHGECVRALFEPTASERFVFDVEEFQQQQLKQRQSRLSAYACTSAAVSKHNEDEVIHDLVQDYFRHYGYMNALLALEGLHRTSTSNTHKRSDSSSESLPFRHKVRQLIYSHKTQEALDCLHDSEPCRGGDDSVTLDPHLLMRCHMLCVVDALCLNRERAHQDTEWNVNNAVSVAQKLLQPYLQPSANSDDDCFQDIREFMSVLLYASTAEIPVHAPGRKYLLWSFREQVVDSLNEVLLSANRRANQDQDSPKSALELLAEDLCDLQQECLSSGVPAFPLGAGDWLGAGEQNRKRRSSHRSRRSCLGTSMSANSDESSDDANDDDDDGSVASSSVSYESGEDEDDDE